MIYVLKTTYEKLAAVVRHKSESEFTFGKRINQRKLNNFQID